MHDSARSLRKFLSDAARPETKSSPSTHVELRPTSWQQSVPDFLDESLCIGSRVLRESLREHLAQTYASL